MNNVLHYYSGQYISKICENNRLTKYTACAIVVLILSGFNTRLNYIVPSGQMVVCATHLGGTTFCLLGDDIVRGQPVSAFAYDCFNYDRVGHFNLYFVNTTGGQNCFLTK